MEIKSNFGKHLCDDETLKKFMPNKYYKKYKKLKSNGEPLDIFVAQKVAKAIKKWAFNLGATHYTHWFLPLTNKSAEKQVSFVELDKDGKMIEDFNEKALIKSEADASSFPNGGSRITFEARGYTIWDYTSPIFMKENSNGDKVVYIPTAFCSYNGTALDEKTPLLRSLESLNKQSVRVLHCLGYKNIKKVNLMIGAEQEYFLIKKEIYEKRFDLKMVERTLFGSKPIKSQENYSHYFGMIDDDISVVMNEIDRELWTMGITAKLQHNEVAQRQYELVPIFTYANVANDQNQIIMDVIKRVAKKYGYEAIFNEKPFKYTNGSGKHLNISLLSDNNINLFDIKNDAKMFYAFYTAMVMAVNTYSDLINMSTSYYSNEFRLGGNEAPPKIVSLFVSDYILDFVEKMKNSTEFKSDTKTLNTGVKSISSVKKDFCDRNRTSPFAFSGNKFEFRMVGSSQTVAFPTMCIASALSYSLKIIADKLEKSDDAIKVLSKFIDDNKRIIFNGDSYSKEWLVEATKRNLTNNKTTYENYEILTSKEIKNMFEKTNILNNEELVLRKNTLKSNYTNSVLLDAKTMKYMLTKFIIPKLYDCKNNCKFVNIENNLCELEKLTNKLNNLISKFDNTTENIIEQIEDLKTLMTKTRDVYDNIEEILPYDYEILPNHNEILS